MPRTLGSAAIAIALAASSVFLLGGSAAGGGRCDLVGTDGPDVLKGEAARRLVICARGGDDRVLGGAGNTIIRGAEGDDWMSGSSGNDRLRGSVGADRLQGSSGADRLRGGPDDDKLVGGSGPDVLSGGPGDDRINSTAFGVVDGAPEDQVDGGLGFDTCIVDEHDEAICEKVILREG